ncbi:MAG TPA: protein phosphatase 2C domain-containing protein [Jatrophihabitans sp.]|jgi:hypothetical protein
MITDAYRLADRTDGGWTVVGASVTGADHRRQSLPNQDAYAYRDYGSGVVAVVADGHGAAQHPRSALGARLAADLLADRLGTLDSAESEQDALPAAADSFVRAWRAAVASDLASHPLDRLELAEMGRDSDSLDFVRSAYGTTVLGIRASAKWVSAIAIGDGELGCVDAAARHHPLCAAQARIGVETDSLAAPELSLRLQTVPAAGVVAVWACTDGFSEAQRDPEWRALVAGQLHALPGASGVLPQDLRGWLAPSAETGGDDTTMVLVLRRR